MKIRNYLVNKSCIAIPFYPENGEINPDNKNQIHVREVSPDLDAAWDACEVVLKHLYEQPEFSGTEKGCMIFDVLVALKKARGKE